MEITISKDHADKTEPHFWLHVPLQTRYSEWLTPPNDGRLLVLGHACQLRAAQVPLVPVDMTASTVAVRQYLLFDPLPEAKARELLQGLVSRMPILAFKERALFEIPNHAWVEKKDQINIHNLTYPALIPSHLKPEPVSMSVHSSRSRRATDFLGPKLENCPTVTDERILAAIDLANATQQDGLARSRFLSWLTIIDSLAVRKDRTTDIRAWLDEKIAEATLKKYDGLPSALRNLKQESHGSAIKNLIARAARALGESEETIRERQASVGKLYGTRSRLSHAGSRSPEGDELTESQNLMRLLLDAVIQYPGILDE